MSTKSKLTRAEAVAIVGEAAVAHLETLPCDATSRRQTDGDDSVEFVATAETKDGDGTKCYVSAYYYQAPADLKACEERGGDLSDLDWIIDGYDVS